MIRCAYFIGSKRLKNDRKPLFTVLWNLRVKSIQFLGNFNNKPLQIDGDSTILYKILIFMYLLTHLIVIEEIAESLC